MFQRRTSLLMLAALLSLTASFAFASTHGEGDWVAFQLPQAQGIQVGEVAFVSESGMARIRLIDNQGSRNSVYVHVQSLHPKPVVGGLAIIRQEQNNPQSDFVAKITQILPAHQVLLDLGNETLVNMDINRIRRVTRNAVFTPATHLLTQQGGRAAVAISPSTSRVQTWAANLIRASQLLSRFDDGAVILSSTEFEKIYIVQYPDGALALWRGAEFGLPIHFFIRESESLKTAQVQVARGEITAYFADGTSQSWNIRDAMGTMQRASNGILFCASIL